MTNLENWFSKIQQIIEAPFPNECNQLAGWMHSAELETHLLATPRRKTALIMDQAGDYENDENMTQDSEFAVSLEIDECYSALRHRIASEYGEPIELEVDDSSLQARVEPDDYDFETESYLLGAWYDNCDHQEVAFWRIGSNYLCLQKIKNWGDGNFQFYVLATVTPCETE